MDNERIYLMREKEREMRKQMNDLYSDWNYKGYLESDRIVWQDIFEDILYVLLITGLIIITILI